MRLSLRFVLPLMLVLAGIAYAVTPLVDRLTLSWFVHDLNSRSSLIANTIQEPLVELLTAGKRIKILEYFNRITQDERLFAVGYCATPKSRVLATHSLPAEIRCSDLQRWQGPDHLLTSANGPLHVTVRPMPTEAEPGGRLVLVHDMSFITRRSEETKRYVFYLFMGLAAVVSLVTVIIAQLSWRGWMAGMRSLLRGEGLLRQPGTVALPEPARVQAHCARSAATDPRTGIRCARARRGPGHLDAGVAARHSARRTARRRRDRGVQPRALHPPAPRRSHRGAAARERAGHRAGADHARLLRHLDRPWQRLGRSRNGRQARSRRGAAGKARLPDPPRLAYAGGGGRLLLRLRQRGAVAAVPHRPCAADLPLGRLGPVRRGQPQVRQAPWRARPRPRTPSCWCRTTTSRCCRA